MADEQYAEIKEKFGGTWKLDRSEHFEDFLREAGVNIVIRKMAGLEKPTSEITVEDGKVSISYMEKCDTFQLREEYDTEFQGQKVKGKASYTDGILTIDNNPVDANVKPTKVTRQITEDDELLVTIYVGDVVCKRLFKRLLA